MASPINSEFLFERKYFLSSGVSFALVLDSIIFYTSDKCSYKKSIQSREAEKQP
jgi:hypothetical protein